MLRVFTLTVWHLLIHIPLSRSEMYESSVSDQLLHATQLCLGGAVSHAVGVGVSIESILATFGG